MTVIFWQILNIGQIVRPGGMERPTDSFKETHNLVLANEDTYFGGLVSNLQVNLYYMHSMQVYNILSCYVDHHSHWAVEELFWLQNQVDLKDKKKKRFEIYQVAELMASMAKNRRLSCCKVVEVIAETTSPLLPIEQLLSTVPSQRVC